MCSVKRASNFNSREEALLISLVQKYKAVIECRKTDAVNNEKKMGTWAKIASEFNSSSGVAYRDVKILKNKYENIKKRTKKKSAEEKSSIFYTGGGPLENVIFTPVEEQVKDILGVRIDGLCSEFDSDVLGDAILPTSTEGSTENHGYDYMNDHDYDSSYKYEENVESSLRQQSSFVEETNTEDFIVIEEAQQQVDEFKPERQKGDWKKATPSLLQQSKSLALQTPTGNHSRKRDMSKKMERWVASKTTFEETKERLLIEESELRKEIMQKQHEKKMDLLEREYEERQRRENEEHKIKMDILKLQTLKQ